MSKVKSGVSCRNRCYHTACCMYYNVIWCLLLLYTAPIMVSAMIMAETITGACERISHHGWHDAKHRPFVLLRYCMVLQSVMEGHHAAGVLAP